MIDVVVIVYIAQQIFRVFGTDIGVMIYSIPADNNVFFVNHFPVFSNTQTIFTCGNILKGVFCIFRCCGLLEQRLLFPVWEEHDFDSFVLLYAIDLAGYARSYAAQTAIYAHFTLFANVCFREANEANCAVPFIVKLFCKTFSASAAGIAIFITETVRAFHTVPAGIVFSAVKFKTVTTFNAVTFIFKSTIPALMADVAVVIDAITAFSASYAFVINIIASLAIGAVRSAYNPAVSTIIPALGAHFGAVFAKIAI